MCPLSCNLCNENSVPPDRSHGSAGAEGGWIKSQVVLGVGVLVLTVILYIVV